MMTVEEICTKNGCTRCEVDELGRILAYSSAAGLWAMYDPCDNGYTLTGYTRNLEGLKIVRQIDAAGNTIPG